MRNVTDFLTKSGVQYFSTVGEDGRPKVRPFQFMLEENGKLYFCTSNKKNVFKEISANPFIEVCASGENNSWLRLSGKAVFSGSMEIKTRIQDSSPLVKSIYNTPDNPDFEIFYLENAVAVISDFSGNPPLTINL
ncbi:MAG: pyridoxamine 5'-phosphate oxidase family protein [Spirochaetes bacterium]|nr:pyridoxamine 5'-phosphate oxidase family protein [Spirochaetota bacterium]